MAPRWASQTWIFIVLALTALTTAACASQTLCDYVACTTDDGTGTAGSAGGGGSDAGGGGGS